MGSDRLTIIAVQPEDLASVWIEYIRNDIKQVAKKSKVDYQPLDVLRMLKNKRAFAALLEYDNNHLGTLILRPVEEEFSHRLILHVWILAMSKTKFNGSGDLLDEIWKFVKDQAEQINAKLVQVISDRRGWKKRLEKYGFKPCNFQAYHREIGQ